MQIDSPIRVLQVTIGDGSFGGVASFMYTFYSHMDHGTVHFDFLYCGENSMQSKENDPFLEGSTITTLHILKRNNNGFHEYKKLIPALKAFFDENEYDIVHVNSGNAFLNACVAYTLRRRAVLISHSHSAAPSIRYGGRVKNMIKSFIRNTVRGYIVKKADALYACSDQAGISLFGEKGIRKNKYKVIRNAIDTERFRFNLQTRQKQRVGGELIIGFVGRLSDEKNPLFAVDVFKEVLKRRSDSVLWVAGDGELQDRLEKKIRECGAGDRTVLYGRRDDIQDLVQAMDVLIMPSVWEGFGISAVEAQCAGLSVLASDRVPQAANIAGLVTYLPLSVPPETWADRIMEIVAAAGSRCDHSTELKNAHYDIFSEAESLENDYKELYARFHKED